MQIVSLEMAAYQLVWETIPCSFMKKQSDRGPKTLMLGEKVRQGDAD